MIEYDKIADKYDLIYSTPECKYENNLIKEDLVKYGFEDGRTLDIGCGTGLFLEFIQKGEYLGVDSSVKMIEKAREKFPQNKFIIDNAENLNDTVHFDNVVFLFSFCHFINPQKILTKVIKLVDGPIYIITPSLEHEYWNGFMPETLKYSDETLNDLLSQYFTVKETDYLNERYVRAVGITQAGLLTVKQFINSQTWIFAKTYARTFPHEYIVRKRVANQEMFNTFIRYIRQHGRREKFFKNTYIYLYLDGYKYWTMGAPVEETTIINRERLYGYSKKNRYECF